MKPQQSPSPWAMVGSGSFFLAAADFTGLAVAFDADTLLLPRHHFLFHIFLAALIVCAATVLAQEAAQRLNPRWRVSWSFSTALGIQLAAPIWGVAILTVLHSTVRFDLLEAVAAVCVFQFPINTLAVGLAILVARPGHRLTEPS